jgi:hypothetical protein
VNLVGDETSEAADIREVACARMGRGAKPEPEAGNRRCDSWGVPAHAKLVMTSLSLQPVPPSPPPAAGPGGHQGVLFRRTSCRLPSNFTKL